MYVGIERMNFHIGRLVVIEFMYPSTRNTIYDDYLPTTAKAATELVQLYENIYTAINKYSRNNCRV